MPRDLIKSPLGPKRDHHFPNSFLLSIFLFATGGCENQGDLVKWWRCWYGQLTTRLAKRRRRTGLSGAARGVAHCGLPAEWQQQKQWRGIHMLWRVRECLAQREVKRRCWNTAGDAHQSWSQRDRLSFFQVLTLSNGIRAWAAPAHSLAARVQQPACKGIWSAVA